MMHLWSGGAVVLLKSMMRVSCSIITIQEGVLDLFTA